MSKILYKRPELRVSSTNEVDSQSGKALSFFFKLNFPPCDDFIRVKINFVQDDSSPQKIAQYNEDYRILNKDNISISLDEDTNNLNSLEFYFINNRLFILELLPIKTLPFDQYVIFELENNPRFSFVQKQIEGKILGTESILIERDITVKDSFCPDTGEVNSIEDIDISNPSYIDYSKRKINYSTVVIPQDVPRVFFEKTQIDANSIERISVLRENPLEFNSKVRFDVYYKTGGEYIIFPQSRYLHFFPFEDVMYIDIAELPREIDVDAEIITLKLRLVSEDNALVDYNSEIEINYV